MNYNIQSRIHDIIEVFNRITRHVDYYYPKRVHEALLKVHPEFAYKITINKKYFHSTNGLQTTYKQQ